jgi:hypothetical protein
MSADPTSLDHLFDIVTPPPVPNWPPAPGWFVVGGVVLMLLFWIAWRAWRHWQAASYRRAAPAEWQQLKIQTADPRLQEAALRHLPELMKRTALAAFPRAEVASLSGIEWLRFLDRTGHTDAFTRGHGQLLPELAYDPRAVTQLGAASVEELFGVIRLWIAGHVTTVQVGVSTDIPEPIPPPSGRGAGRGW